MFLGGNRKKLACFRAPAAAGDLIYTQDTYICTHFARFMNSHQFGSIVITPSRYPGLATELIKSIAPQFILCVLGGRLFDTWLWVDYAGS